MAILQVWHNTRLPSKSDNLNLTFEQHAACIMPWWIVDGIKSKNGAQCFLAFLLHFNSATRYVFNFYWQLSGGYRQNEEKWVAFVCDRSNSSHLSNSSIRNRKASFFSLKSAINVIVLNLKSAQLSQTKNFSRIIAVYSITRLVNKNFRAIMTDFQPLEQPWKSWYARKETQGPSTNYVGPVMAAGNVAPLSKKNGRLDLSRPKTGPDQGN